jgi:hypothetical protein
MKFEANAPGPLENLAVLLERADDAAAAFGRIRPVRTSRGLVAVMADHDPTTIPVVHSLVFDGSNVTVDIRGCKINTPPEEYEAKEHESLICLLDELGDYPLIPAETPVMRRRRSEVRGTIARIAQSGSAYDALHDNNDGRVHPVSGLSYGPGFYFQRLLELGEQFPPAVMEAGLAIPPID